MKRMVLLVLFLVMVGLACDLSSMSSTPVNNSVLVTQVTTSVVTQVVTAPQVTQVVTSDVINCPNPILIEAEGRSSSAIATDVEPYLIRTGWGPLDRQGDALIMSAPAGLDLREPGLAYSIRFDNNGPRYLAIITTMLYFVPEKVGEPFDEKNLFSAMEMSFPALSIYHDLNFMHQVTFRGAYSFYVRMDVVDFVGYMDFYAYSVDMLLYKNPFFSKQ